jgi:hypothetical protein
MGKWLAALRTSEKKSENATDANPQNHQNPSEGGFGGFEGNRSSAFAKIHGVDREGFEGFEGSPSEAFPIFQYPDHTGWDEEDWQVAFEERAAILEYDEGLSRPDAARLARQQIDQQRRTRWN